MLAQSLRRWSALFLFLAFPGRSAEAEQILVYDREPNDRFEDAVVLSTPAEREVVRIIGELQGKDQDAYYWSIDEEEAGTRWKLRLEGRAGAKTQLDLFDLTDFIEGEVLRNRVGMTLEKRPPTLGTLATRDGTRPAVYHDLLLEPGNYALGISHSGGEGAYAIEISRVGSERVGLVEDGNSRDKPRIVQERRANVFMAQGETVLGFDLDEAGAGQAWSLTTQTPLGTRTRLSLLDGEGQEVLQIDADGGLPVRRAGLSLAPGSYHLIAQSPTRAVQRVLLEPGPVASDGAEIEPNDREEQANDIAPGQAISGQIGNPDYGDWLRFTIDAESEGRSWDLVATTEGEFRDLRLCLFSRSLNIQHCRDRGADGNTTLHGIALPQGDYLLRVDPRGGNGQWHLEWQEGEPAEPGLEVEPNDSARFASVFPDRPVARGYFHGNESDFWRFTVSGEPQLWRAQLQGQGIFELWVLDTAGQLLQKVRAPGGAERIRLENLYLRPGEYFVGASGTDGDYRLLLRALGPPDPNGEIEPNGSYQNALPLALGQTRNGYLPEQDDIDIYQFELAGPEHVRLTATPPADGTMSGVLAVGDNRGQVSIIHGNVPGQPMVWDAFLPAGDYSLALTVRSLSAAEYHVGLERLDWFDGSIDREPNDDHMHASAVGPRGDVRGRLGATRNKTDWFRLPAAGAPVDVFVPALTGIHARLLAEDDRNANLLLPNADNGGQRASLSPEKRYLLELSGDGDYAFNLFHQPSAGPAGEVLPSPESAPAPVELSIHLDDVDTVQAWSSWEQVLSGRIGLVNTGVETRNLSLEAVLSDNRWRIEAERTALTLAGSEAIEVPFTLVVPPDAFVVPPVRINIQAVDAAGARISALAEVSADPDHLPVNPRHPWSLQPPLRGGFNVAAASLGGRAVNSQGIGDHNLQQTTGNLINGLATYGNWTETELAINGDQPMQPTIDLAGDEPVPVAGFLLNPTSTVSPNTFLRDFAVALSLDGEQFTTVFKGQLNPAPREQAFVLNEPVEARFARLIPLTSSFGVAGAVKLGEFKVIAQPGFVPEGLEKPNLTATDLGGHLVWSDPWIANSGFDTSLLARDGESPSLRPAVGEPAQVVLGFHHSRAGRIAGFSLEPLEGQATDSAAVRVEVDRAMGSPAGPFEPVGEWPLDAGSADITFDEPVWARYLRFRFELPDGQRTLTLPDRIAVWESPASGGESGYTSVLAEWGHYSSNGPFEVLHEPRWVGPSDRPGNDSRERALALQPGDVEAGVALLQDYDAWYRFDVPAGLNTVDLTLEGLPALQAAPQLLDAEDNDIPLFEERETPQTVHWQAFVKPGETYWLRVYEPPRALMFTWDTSASVGWYLPSMANALYRYAEHIRPGIDEVNLLPFGRQSPLLREWEGQPYPLKLMLNSYPHETSSSNAEGALLAAAKALEDRPGKRGIILLTDAATNFEHDLWPALREVRPIVFAMSVSSEGALSSNPVREQDLMQEWSRVNGGDYEYVTGLGVLQRAYARAIAKMRQPVPFEVRANFTFTEDPGPATLAVVSGEAPLDPAARGAVELILDASGSMLKRMGERRRIAIAKAAIAEVVDSVLPEGMPLALRVYGHREAGSCRTDLELPLGPLDKAALHRKLEEINAVNLAKTPIAESLRRVADDLAGAEGRRWVILLTDGEETCEGDVDAVLTELADKGIDVRLNIVGFAIGDDALKAEFSRLAEMGGGSYFDAGEADALTEAMKQSLQIPFRVFNDDGQEVASGVLDGAALELPAGRYSVTLETTPPQRFRDVQLAPGQHVGLVGGEP